MFLTGASLLRTLWRRKETGNKVYILQSACSLIPFCHRQWRGTTMISKWFLYFSNNMLYPKEDKENRVLLYAVSIPNTISG